MPEEAEGYPPIGTLLRQGPQPYIRRLLNSDEYDQGVLKMMAGENLTRDEAQGSFDAYMRNPNDWTYNKLQERKGGFKIDYAKAPDTKSIVLTVSWGIIATTFVGRVIYLYTVGCDEFCKAYNF